MRVWDPSLAPELDQAVLRALARDPNERPTVGQFEQMLVRALRT